MIAIIGAGLQGACLALELALRGRDVTVIDAAADPMTEASRWNEGKLHLGFVYAADPSRRSAAAMLEASLAFLPTLSRLLEQDLSHLVSPVPFLYGVPTDTQVSADRVADHFATIGRQLEVHAGDWSAIFGDRHTWHPPVEMDPGLVFTEGTMLRAFRTPEVAMDTHGLADLVAARLRDHPRVRLVLGTDVAGVERRGGGFRLHLADGGVEDGFSQVVNASWRSLLRLDATAGVHPGRPWLYRYKIAVHVCTDVRDIPSCTFITGPYGDVASLGDGRFFLSWYPACRLALSDQADLPDLDATLTPELRADIAQETLDGLSTLVPAVAGLSVDEAAVKGGWIFAWGASDITDRGSELHRRHDVGAFIDRGYISLNTGKYCMAPLHATRLADLLSLTS